MSLPADARSILSTSTAVHEFDPELDIPVVLDEKPVDPFLVRFSPGDPRNPKVRPSRSSTTLALTFPLQNWSHLKRWYLTMAGGLLVLSAFVSIQSTTFISLTVFPQYLF